MIRWGIIGTGRIANTFAEDLKFVENAKLVGVSSRAEETARAFAAQHGIDKYHSSYQGVVEQKDVDAIYIATPHSLHAENMLSCLEGGKPVLCEKPFTINEAQARTVIDRARKKQILLVEGMWTFFQPAFRKLIEQMQTGELGKLISIDADLGFVGNPDLKARLYNPELGGGSLLDMGVYNLSLVSALMGDPNSIHASCEFTSTGVDTKTEISLIYGQNAPSYLRSSIVEHSRRSAILYFEQATVTIPDPWWHFEKIIISYKNGKTTEYSSDRTGYGFVPMIRDFNQCLESGKTESSIISLDHTLNVMRLMDRVRKEIGLHYPQDSHSVFTPG